MWHRARFTLQSSESSLRASTCNRADLSHTYRRAHGKDVSTAQMKRYCTSAIKIVWETRRPETLPNAIEHAAQLLPVESSSALERAQESLFRSDLWRENCHQTCWCYAVLSRQRRRQTRSSNTCKQSGLVNYQVSLQNPNGIK